MAHVHDVRARSVATTSDCRPAQVGALAQPAEQQEERHARPLAVVCLRLEGTPDAEVGILVSMRLGHQATLRGCWAATTTRDSS
eukprot:4701698-Pleurochrysis_carterae.AAC.1